MQGNSHTGSKARQQELDCSIIMSAASLIKMQHMAQTAFRLLLPDSRTSSLRQRLAYLLLLIPVSPQHMANYILNSSLKFCMQKTFFSLLQRSRIVLISLKQHHTHTTFFPHRCVQILQYPLVGRCITLTVPLLILTPLPIQCLGFPQGMRSSQPLSTDCGIGVLAQLKE